MRSRGSRHVGLLGLGVLVLDACAGDPTAPTVPAAEMLGDWSYASVPAARDLPSLNGGLQVSMAIDSPDGMRFRGRVTRWFAGDVGESPAVFGPITGWVDGNGGVTVLMARATLGAPTLTIVGALAGDVLTVRKSWLGAEPGPFLAGGWFERIR